MRNIKNKFLFKTQSQIDSTINKLIHIVCFLSMLCFGHLLNAADIALTEEQKALYEQIMPENFRLNQPAETEKSFKVHLKDSYLLLPQPIQFKLENIKYSVGTNLITGTITYASVIKKRYKIDLIRTQQNQFTMQIRIFLKNGTSEDYNNFQQKILEAQNIWNANKPTLDFDYQFEFILTQQPENAHFKVTVLDKTDGPYDTFWSRDWPAQVLTHEIGHMLGLGDEYNTISGTFDCLRESLMCTAYRGQHMYHHYYFILRRLFE